MSSVKEKSDVAISPSEAVAESRTVCKPSSLPSSKIPGSNSNVPSLNVMSIAAAPSTSTVRDAMPVTPLCTVPEIIGSKVSKSSLVSSNGPVSFFRSADNQWRRDKVKIRLKISAIVSHQHKISSVYRPVMADIMNVFDACRTGHVVTYASEIKCIHKCVFHTAPDVA